MKKRFKVLSVILSFVLFAVHLNAITSQAAPLGTADSAAVSNAIMRTQQQKIIPKKDYFETLNDGSTRFVKSLAITNLARPQHGKLLDESATVITDGGFSWDIPVIWTNKDGDIIHVAIEIDDLVKSYPVFVFYMPEGYALLLGEKSGYDIQMPDFVVDLMKVNGVTTLSMPENGLTYISSVLPEMGGTKVAAEQKTQTETVKDSVTEDTNDSNKDHDDKEAGNNQDNKDTHPQDQNGSDHVNEGAEVTPPSKPHMTEPTDNDSTPPATGLSDEENQKLVEAHCDKNVIEKIGTDKLSALVNWVKNTLEPETVSLLTSKFPAFKKATEKGELGKNIGLYVYYNTYYDEDGKAHDKSRSLASVDTVSDSSGKVKYRLSVNAGGFYDQNPETGEYEFNKSDAYTDLDNTLVHEMMHAFMYDYTRTGMTGWEYDKSDGAYDLAAEDELRFPKWFSEGVASTVENTFQYWKDEFYQYYNNGKKSSFSEDTMKKSYKSNPEYNLNGSDVESDYITGYLACLYLSYLNAKKDNKEAITGSIETGDLRVDSDVLREGLNGILEDLHKGKSLDKIIANVSKVDGKSMYKNTQDFENKFIIGDKTDKASVRFCADVLNYMHSASSEKEIANGSILIDLADTNKNQLSKSQLKNKQKAYEVTDDSDFAASTVNKKSALKSGGTSDDGIVGTSESSNSDKIANGETPQTKTEEAAKISNKTDEAPVKDAQSTKDEGKKADEAVEKEPSGTSEKTAEKASETDKEKTTEKISEEKTEETAEKASEENTEVSEEPAEEKLQEASDETTEDMLNEASEDEQKVTSDESDGNSLNAEDTENAENTDNTALDEASEPVETAEPSETSENAENTENTENVDTLQQDNTESSENTKEQNEESQDGENVEMPDTAEQAVTDAGNESSEELSGEANDEPQEESHEESQEESHEAVNEAAQEETHEEVKEDSQEENHDDVNEETHEEAGEESQDEAQQETHEDTDESSSDTENTEENTEESDTSSEPEESYESPVTISETQEEPEESSDDDLSEQVLDAIVEDDSSEDE